MEWGEDGRMQGGGENTLLPIFFILSATNRSVRPRNYVK